MLVFIPPPSSPPLPLPPPPPLHPSSVSVKITTANQCLLGKSVGKDIDISFSVLAPINREIWLLMGVASCRFMSLLRCCGAVVYRQCGRSEIGWLWQYTAVMVRQVLMEDKELSFIGTLCKRTYRRFKGPLIGFNLAFVLSVADRRSGAPPSPPVCGRYLR